MPTVFRVETHDGLGPYTGYFSYVDWSNDHTKHQCLDTHPNMYNDGFTEHQEHMYFGFISMEQLRKWFSVYELRKLKSLGYRIKRYIVPVYDIAHGHTKTQIMFVKP